MKQEFIEFLKTLMAAHPDTTESLMTETVQAYIDALSSSVKEKPPMTEGGKTVLLFMQEANQKTFKCKNVAEALGLASRSVSGALRKLVADGYCEKVSQDPVIYALTEKGKQFKIN